MKKIVVRKTEAVKLTSRVMPLYTIIVISVSPASCAVA
jgi:hypothetical protein